MAKTEKLDAPASPTPKTCVTLIQQPNGGWLVQEQAPGKRYPSTRGAFSNSGDMLAWLATNLDTPQAATTPNAPGDTE